MKRYEGRNLSKLAAGVLAAGAILLAASPAFAQGVINLEETVIEGRIQKPEAFYILQHASLNYEQLDPKPSFIPELLKTVDDDTFEGGIEARSGSDDGD